MRELVEVRHAKALMMEAMSWSVVKWLAEKKRVRKAADRANDALDALDKEVKAGWNERLKAAYAAASQGQAAQKLESSELPDAELVRQARRLRDADEDAYRARMTAEDTFDEAEKKLSTSLAREGCRQAIRSWELHEAAIKKSEAAGEPLSD